MVVKNPRFRYPKDSFEYQRNRALHYRDYIENFYIEVPCGKCYLCRKKKANGWRIRLLEEYKSTPSLYEDGVLKKRIVFVLFTFDREHLPKKGTRKEFADLIRKWRDLWRKKYGCSPRYWAVTDRGSRRARLHLHFLIFNPYDKKNDRLLNIADLEEHHFFWRNGMVREPSWIESERGIVYVTGYLTGSNLEKDAMKHGHKICKESLEYIPFVFCSNGLGASFMNNPVLSYDAKLNVHLYKFQGYYYGIPAYYRYKLIDEDFRWHSNLLNMKAKQDYMLYTDNVKYYLSGSVYDFDGLQSVYDKVYKKFDSDENKQMKMLYVK